MKTSSFLQWNRFNMKPEREDTFNQPDDHGAIDAPECMPVGCSHMTEFGPYQELVMREGWLS